MQEVRYMISDTARKVDVEAHVLRYWEEELEIPIARNEMGHRYYTPDNITLLKNVKALKEQGFQLRAIKILLPQLMKQKDGKIEQFFDLREELNYQVSAMGQEVLAKEHNYDSNSNKALPKVNDESGLVRQPEQVNQLHNQKLVQFQNIIKSAITEVLEENNFALEERVGDKVIKHVDYMFRENDEREDERFKKLDEAIRSKLKTRKEAAAAKDVAKSKNKKIFFVKK